MRRIPLGPALGRTAAISVRLACAALACAHLGGCGQTGPLTLPSKEGEVESKGPDASIATPAAGPTVTTPDPNANPDTTPAADSESARKRQTAPQ